MIEMAHDKKVLHVSLFVGLVSVLTNDVAFGAVRIGNKTKNDVYRQMVAANTMVATQNTVTTEPELPVRVADEDLAKQIVSGTSNIGMDKLASCSKIYPNGEFAWDKPTAGIGAGGASTCVAVIELRGYQMGKNGADAVFARVNVAPGASVKCNISEFPEFSYLPDAENAIFPADQEPTVQDVINVMNQEQKQNAGLKIAAGALIGALGGNIAGKNDVGKDGLLGTSDSKITGTVVGALSGAAITAGSAYAGYEAGNMIMSTGINAAAGGVVGNIMSSGDPVMRIEECKDKDGNSAGKCLWGYVVEGEPITLDKDGNVKQTGESKSKERLFYNVSQRNVVKCTEEEKEKWKCRRANLALVKVKVDNKDEFVNDLTKNTSLGEKFEAGKASDSYYTLVEEDGYTRFDKGITGSNDVYVPVSSAKTISKKTPAMVMGVEDKVFGIKRSDWTEWKQKNNDKKIYRRGNDGNATKDNPMTENLDSFEPIYVDSSDGGVIDLNNKARLKDTLIGSGAGGALGAYVAYQGAQSDIDERWVAAVREYKDSLQKFYCATGSRFISYYNDVVTVPKIDE